MFSDAELALGYETTSLTFLDLYFINGYQDVLYLLPDNATPSTSPAADAGPNPAAEGIVAAWSATAMASVAPPTGPASARRSS